MKLSLNWLNDFIDLSDLSPQEIAHRLTLSTCEIEGWEERYSHLDQVFLAQVREVRQHPNADRLKLCQVRHRKKNLSVVCGAANVRPGMLGAFAPVGTLLPATGDAPAVAIRRAVIRGIASEGMLCSPAELQLESIFSGEGILDLEEFASESAAPGDAAPGDAAPGGAAVGSALLSFSDLKPARPLSQILPFRDTIFEVDNKSITHRPDLWSHFGFARELAAILGRQISFQPLEQRFRTSRRLPRKNIHLQEGAALAYFGAHIGGVEVGPSPLKIQARLLNVGQKPINNVVDASNYLMFEAGQPSHAFDASSLRSKSISVSLTAKNFTVADFEALDGQRYSLQPGTVVILDGVASKGRVVALGGVIGGASGGVRPDTTELFVESATFPRERIRRTIMDIGLRTEAARRFEKGQDAAMARPALFRFAQLLQISSPALQLALPNGAVAQRRVGKHIGTSLDFLQRRLGFAISAAQVEDILTRLQFRVQSHLPSPPRGRRHDHREYGLAFRITVPSFRSQYDVTLPEDIVEELGRLYIYDNIEPIAPSAALDAVPVDQVGRLLRLLKEYMAQSGRFSEVYNYSFASHEDNRLFEQNHNILRGGGRAIAVELKNPVVAHKRQLRLSQLPGLLRQVALNQDRYEEVRLFECGRIYCQRASGKEPGGKAFLQVGATLNSGPNSGLNAGPVDERIGLSLAWMPSQRSQSAQSAQSDMLEHFLELRLLLDRLLGWLGIDFRAADFRATDNLRRATQTADRAADRGLRAGRASSSPPSPPPPPPGWLHPSAAIAYLGSDGALLGYLGLLHPLWERNFGLKRQTIVGDFDFYTLYQAYQRAEAHLRYASPSVYPDSYFELSLILPIAESSLRPVEVIRSLHNSYIRQIDWLTEYEGAPLPPGQKSVSYQIRCASSKGTLSGKDLQQILDAVCAALESRGYPLRQ